MNEKELYIINQDQNRVILNSVELNPQLSELKRKFDSNENQYIRETTEIKIDWYPRGN